jgi:hypothetical protein
MAEDKPSAIFYYPPFIPPIFLLNLDSSSYLIYNDNQVNTINNTVTEGRLEHD